LERGRLRAACAIKKARPHYRYSLNQYAAIVAAAPAALPCPADFCKELPKEHKVAGLFGRGDKDP
jgi:hypothetical protein